MAYGLMKITKLGGGRYVGIPIHIAGHVEEGQNLKMELQDNNKLVCVPVTDEEYARSDTSRVRLRTAYDEQKWFRIPTALVRTLDSGMWEVGEQIIVRRDMETGVISVQPTAAKKVE